MSISLRPARLARLLEAVEHLASSGSLTPDALSGLLGVSGAAAVKLIDSLNQAGVPVDTTPEGYRLSPPLAEPPQPLTVNETAALSLGLAWLHERGAVSSDDVRAIRAKLFPQREAVTPPADAVDSRASVSTPHDPGVAAALHQAVFERQRVEIVYASKSQGKTTERDLSPYTMVNRRDSWYAIGYCHARRAIRTFKVSRIQSSRLSPRSFYLDPDYDPDEFLKYRWNIMDGEPQVVLARFDQTAGPLLLEKRFAHGRAWREGEWIYLKTIVSGLDEFSWWIMQYGEHAEVIQPLELRRALARRCAVLAERYSDAYTERSRRLKP